MLAIIHFATQKRMSITHLHCLRVHNRVSVQTNAAQVNAVDLLQATDGDGGVCFDTST